MKIDIDDGEFKGMREKIFVVELREKLGQDYMIKLCKKLKFCGIFIYFTSNARKIKNCKNFRVILPFFEKKNEVRKKR